MHTLDPRGNKIGGIETHVRQVMSKHPDDISVLFVGVDEIGDAELGRVHPVKLGDRLIDSCRSPALWSMR